MRLPPSVAFARLHSQEGKGAAAIASEFGVTDRYVRQRMKLATLTEPVKAAYRDRSIDTATAEAFAAVPEDRQQAVWKELGGVPRHHALHHLSPGFALLVSLAAPLVSATAPLVSATAPLVSAAAPLASAAAPLVSAAAPLVSAAAPLVSAAAPLVQAAPRLIYRAGSLMSGAALLRSIFRYRRPITRIPARLTSTIVMSCINLPEACDRRRRCRDVCRGVCSAGNSLRRSFS